MITFEVKKKQATIGVNKGKEMYYASPKVHQRHTMRELENYIVQATSLARGDVRSALVSFSEFVNTSLAEGKAVDLGDLGMLKVVVGSRQVETAEEVTAAILKEPQVRFYPKEEMRKAAKSVKVKVENPFTHKETETSSDED